MIPKEEEEPEPGVPAWIVGYADLMTLLFATFVVLYGLKPEGRTKAFRGAISRIRESFIEVPDDIPVEEKRGEIILGETRFRKKKGEAATPIIRMNQDETEFPIRVINTDLERIRGTLSTLSRAIDPVSVDDRRVQMFSYSLTEKELKVEFVGRALFDKDAVRPRAAELAALRPVLAALTDIAKPLHIAGHTSDLYEADSQSQWELSSQRAAAFARYIAAEFDFPLTKLTAAGRGARSPLADLTSGPDRWRNERIEITMSAR